MTIDDIFRDTSIKAKGKVSAIGERLASGELSVEEMLVFAERQTPVNKATCIEAAEYATKKAPFIAEQNLLNYTTRCLKEDEPRIKWESAKVIGNIAHRFSPALDDAVTHLLGNAGHPGTVVRWATAYALGEILKLKTDANKFLLPEIEMLYQSEQDNGVKKKYLDALKKVRK